MATTRPRTGEKRRKQQPLKIDRLPIEARDAIQYLKNSLGRTWLEIEEQSARAYSAKWATDRGGFVNWDALDAETRRLFPGRRLPDSNLQRWYDLRVRQVMADVQARSVQARELASSFAKSVVAKDDEAVLNAARDQLMSLLAENSDGAARLVAAKSLIALAEMQQQARANAIKERKIAVDERRITQIEKDAELRRKKFTREMDAAEKKITRGEALTAADIDRIRERVYGIGPSAGAAH